MSVATVEVIPEWTLGDRLRKARVHAGYDQSTLAARIGVAQQAIATWESDKRRPRDLLAVIDSWADATGVPREWLLWGVIPPRITDPGLASLMHGSRRAWSPA